MSEAPLSFWRPWLRENAIGTQTPPWLRENVIRTQSPPWLRGWRAAEARRRGAAARRGGEARVAVCTTHHCRDDASQSAEREQLGDRIERCRLPHSRDQLRLRLLAALAVQLEVVSVQPVQPLRGGADRGIEDRVMSVGLRRDRTSEGIGLRTRSDFGRDPPRVGADPRRPTTARMQ